MQPGNPAEAPPTLIPSAAVPMVTVDAAVQVVYCPVMVSVRLLWPGLPKLGLTTVMTGVPGVTAKAGDTAIKLILPSAQR